jgi:hypothetical protein
MGNREWMNRHILIIVLMILCSSSDAVILRGPTISNSSATAIDLSVTSEGKTVLLLRAFPAGQLFGTPDDLRVTSFSVTAGERRFELGAEEYAAQAKGLSLKKQLWIFDGRGVCVRSTSLLQSGYKTLPTCDD